MRTLGRPRRRWEDNIRIDFKEIGWGKRGLDCSVSGWAHGGGLLSESL